jgi:hypothetical protein
MGSATSDRRLGSFILERRATTAWLLAGLVLGLVLALSGCGAGDGSDSATGPSTERSVTRPATSVTATAPTRTPISADRPTSPPTAPKTSAEAQTQASTPTPSAAGTPASADSQGLEAIGWTLLTLLGIGLIAGWLLWRSRRRSAWDAQAAALEQDSRTAISLHLPSVLTAETAGERALSWPPLRAALSDLMRRWDLLAERRPDDQRQNRAVQIRSVLQELLAAVDVENQALSAERESSPASTTEGVDRSRREPQAKIATRRGSFCGGRHAHSQRELQEALHGESSGQ